jgi:hypothetical protein
MIDQAKLKKEITSDSRYAPHIAIGSDSGVADLLNEVDAAIQIPVTFISREQILAAMDYAEYEALDEIARALLTEYLRPAVRGSAPVDNRAHLSGIFANSPKTLATIEALYSRPGSRAEELFGAGVVVSHLDIADVLNPERNAALAEAELAAAPAKVAQLQADAQAVFDNPEASEKERAKAAEWLAQADTELALRQEEAAKHRAIADEHTAKTDAEIALLEQEEVKSNGK